jgi:ATP-dependent helicase/nuclease subunit B
VGEAVGGFAGFASHARELDASRTLLGWLDWLDGFLRNDPWEMRRRIFAVPGDRFDVARLDLAGWNGLVKIVGEWRGALDEFGAGRETLGVATFASQLASCLTGDVALWSPVQRGVQVLEAFAAAYRKFDHVFIVGLQGGAFPKAVPTSAVLDETERAALSDLGLPLERREVWEARERELFRVLLAGGSHVTLSYARLDGSGREVDRSSFIEEAEDVAHTDVLEIAPSQVTLPRVPLHRTPAALDAALHAAATERARAAALPSEHAGRITDERLLEWLAEEFGDAKVWSPTQLEEFAKCPWSYFSKRLLRVERVDDPSQDMEPSVRGSILHDAMKRFYDAAAERLRKPVFLRAEDARWAEPMMDAAVDAAFDQAAARGWVGHPALREAKGAELRRIAQGFLAWEIQLHEDMYDSKKRNAPKMIRMGVVEHELPFDDMMYERDGVTLRFRGFIDRVETSVDERAPGVRLAAASDYKTTKYTTPGGGEKRAWDDDVVLQVPLYAYALSKLKQDHDVARVDYLALQKPDQVHALELYQFDKKKGEADSVDANQAQWQRALDAAITQVKRARGGEFPAAPPPSCSCPAWCHGRDICRVPGGPRSGGY